MHLAGKTMLTVGAGALTAGLTGLTAALAGLSVPAVVGAAAAGPAPQAAVTVSPGVQHIGRGARQPPTTADCESAFEVACYEPAQIQQAYNLPVLYGQGVNGQGATIVIVDSFGSPTIANDLTTFDQQFGLPAPPSFKIIQPAGAVPPYDSSNSQMVSWAGEASLDVEYAHAIAPGASIVLVETPVSETEGVTGFPQIVKAEEYVINHHIGDVISQSFSATEQTFPSEKTIQALRGAYLDAYAHHVTVLAASGDSGAADVGLDGETYYTYPVTSWPDSDPLVTGVGGTEVVDNDNHYSSTTWNDTYSTAVNEYIFGDAGPNPLAGGGGVSELFTRPAYQYGVQPQYGNHRLVPDISMSAACSGLYDNYESFPAGTGIPNGWYPSCGTSEATPLFSGIVALAAQAAGHPLGLINPTLYRLSAEKAPGIVDITTGNNTVTFTQGTPAVTTTVQGFNAEPGYDLATGVGTVDAQYFVHELAGR